VARDWNMRPVLGDQYRLVYCYGKQKQDTYPDTVEARGVLCYLAVRELGLTTLELSKRLGVSQPTISQSVKRGEGIVKRKDLKISE
jgi:hypothetical protein